MVRYYKKNRYKLYTLLNFTITTKNCFAFLEQRAPEGASTTSSPQKGYKLCNVQLCLWTERTLIQWTSRIGAKSVFLMISRDKVKNTPMAPLRETYLVCKFLHKPNIAKNYWVN